ncbi:DUF1127 domain-containing protein [Rubellimicrobium aerolatum]|uniref:DUF1127 domain-containing protein n=1 Tax=Rubellimicrobium aerolatum TaxID=490979 RepID=A0ABW0SGR9_9RHOB|nr:DUF1127 domain-containing protein [Rubellimicrobium aerolatum]MBP1807472.1 hypothetical protein [Rubellimicrobium aerolatum]
MAMIADTHHHALSHTLAAPFRALWSALLLIAEAKGCMAEVERLNRLSDADLAARGTSREEQVRRIFGVRAAI